MRNLVLLGSVTALAACGPVIGATGSESRNFALSGFDAVRLAGSDDVSVVRGATFSVIARGTKDALDQLDIHTEGSTLVVTRKSRGTWNWSRDGVDVTVTMPAINAAQVTGSGEMTVDRIDGARFEGVVSGSGDLDLKAVEVQSAKLDVTGSGNLQARGRAREVAANLTGSGDLDASGLTAETASVAVRGSGEAKAMAKSSAAITLNGSGDATVSGTRNCTINKTGSGDASCAG